MRLYAHVPRESWVEWKERRETGKREEETREGREREGQRKEPGFGWLL